VIIRAKTFRAWFDANLKESAHDLAEYGAAGGFPGITYYIDTTKLYDKFQDELWEILVDDAEQFGAKNVFEFVAGFGGAKDVGSNDQFKNLVVWYAAEKLARELEDKRYAD